MIAKLNTLGNARSFSNKTIKMTAIILGDDDLFWVVTLGVMERLLKQGYEIAE